MLFSVADDPLAALRWSLLQVRRALTGLAEVSEEQGRLSIGFTARVEVDVPRVLSGDVPADEVKRLQSGELLASLAFDDEPGFDGWLLLQRSRAGAAVGEVLAWVVPGRLPLHRRHLRGHPGPGAVPQDQPQTGAKFNFWHPDLVTLHVWLWYPNPAGLYSGTNPLIRPFNHG